MVPSYSASLSDAELRRLRLLTAAARETPQQQPCDGRPDHTVGQHDQKAPAPRWTKLLRQWYQWELQYAVDVPGDNTGP